MYKLCIVIFCAVLFAYVLARPAQEQQQQQQAVPVSASSSSQSAAAASTSTTPATIIKQVDVNNPDGSYNSSYETSNGIKVENIGYMKKIIVPKTETADGEVLDEHEELILVQEGSYSYMDPEGNVITLRYIADENGFQPMGDHIPKPPQ